MRAKANRMECELEDDAYVFLIAGGAAAAALCLCCLVSRAYQLSLRKDREERRAQLGARGEVVELQNVADPSTEQVGAVFKLTYAPPGSQRSFRAAAQPTAVVLATLPAAVNEDEMQGVAQAVLHDLHEQNQEEEEEEEEEEEDWEGREQMRRQSELALAQRELDDALGRTNRRGNHRPSMWI